MRYLLDTNVVSEARRRRGDPQVASWLDSVPAVNLFLSALVIGEIRRGIEMRRRRDAPQAAALERWLDDLRDRFGDHVVAIDAAIAERWGELSAGDPVPIEDGLMAATAIVHDMVFVTRNVADVARTGVRILNPWDETPVVTRDVRR